MNKSILALTFLVVLALISAISHAQGFRVGEPIKVLYVTGQNNHDWAFTSTHWPAVLEKTGRFYVTRTENPATFFVEKDLRAFDLIVLDYFGERWGEEADRRFMAAVKGGVGVFVLHAADNGFAGWKDYEALVGWSFRENSGHGAFHAFDVNVVDRNHPITRDLPHLKAHPDELYHRLQRNPGAPFRVLMTAESAGDQGGTGNEEPMVMIGQFGKGRVFHTTLGHVWPGQEAQRASVMDSQLQLLMCRGAEWAATGDCTIECKSFGLEPFSTLAKRPRSPWVMRCVLDGRARMIVIGLDEMMNVAFDATHCEPYLVWAGGLKLQGAVFDAVHGPQPEIQGLPFYRNQKIAESPVVVGGEGRPFTFLGYRYEQGSVVLRYRPSDLPEALVEETLEHGEAGQAVLIRKFKVSGFPEGRSLNTNSISRSGSIEIANGETEIVEQFAITKEVE